MRPPYERPQTTDPLPILAHACWLHGLARRLVEDPALADDLVQETQIAAIAAQPDASRPLRGFLATILRHFRRQHHRSQLRREHREKIAAAADLLASHDDPVERLESHRQVVDAVAALAEPYRSTILLRYFEDLAPSAIASRQRVPVATVKTRLQRGLELLRARLARDCDGSGRTWVSLLLPLARPAIGIPTVALGVLSMKLKYALAVIVVGALGVGAFLFDGAGTTSQTKRTEPVSPMQADRAAERTSGDPTVVREVVRSSAPIPKNAAAKDAAPTKAEPKPAPERRILQGIVLDSSANPVPGVELAFVKGRSGEKIDLAAPAPHSGADGRFEAGEPDDWERLIASGTQYATISAAARTERRVDLVVIVGSAVDYSGVVVDEDGRAIPRADIEFHLPRGFRTRFPRVIDSAVDIPIVLQTDESGRFSRERAPSVVGMSIFVNAPGFEIGIVAAPPGGDRALRIVLHKPHRADQRIEGAVVDALGAIVPNALVSLRGEITRTDESGRFALDLDDAAWIARLSEKFGEPAARVAGFVKSSGFGKDSPLALRLIAVTEGALPAIYSPPIGPDGPMFPSFVLLRLGKEPLSIAGTVQDAAGQPAAGVTVWVDDPQVFGASDDGGPLSIEAVVDDRNGRGWRSTTSDSSGHFLVRGLVDRNYRLAAMNSDLLRANVSSVAAGRDDVVLRFSEGAAHASVRGRVVSRHAKPMAGVQVHTQADAFAFGGSTWHTIGEPVTTDADGRFELKNVPKQGVYLRLDGDSIVPLEYGRALPDLSSASKREITDLEILVSVRCHVRVDLGSSLVANEFGIVDSTGAPLPIDLIEGGSRSTRERFELTDGRSAVVSIPDDAVAAVLYLDGTEVRRLPIEFAAEGVTTIKP